MLYFVLVIYAIVASDLSVSYRSTVEQYLDRGEAVRYIDNQTVRSSNPISTGIVVNKVFYIKLDSIKIDESKLKLSIVAKMNREKPIVQARGLTTRSNENDSLLNRVRNHLSKIPSVRK